MSLDGQLVIFMSVFSFVYLIMRHLFEKRSYQRHRSPPSLPSLPLIGSLPFLRNISSAAVFFMEKSKQLGPVFTFRAGNKLVLSLNIREVIEEALVKNSRHFSSRLALSVESPGNPNNKGIIFMKTTPKWKLHRQTALAVMKEFGFGVKSIMQARIQSEIEAMVTFLREKQGQPFDPAQMTILVTGNIITNIIFGRRRDYNDGIPELITQVNHWTHGLDITLDIAPFLRFFPSYAHSLAMMTDCSKKIYSEVDREITKTLEDDVSCFVSRFIEKSGPNYDREQLNYMIRDLISGGADTTSTIFQWMLLALANNPRVQQRLRDENDSMLSRDRLPTIPDQVRLPYHEATILEIYRWRTLISVSTRLTTAESVVRRYNIPAGTSVLSNLHAAHNDPAEWGDPVAFRPERFLDTDNHITGRDRVIPFGIGRRSCFGEILARAEEFLLLASIIQNFVILPPEGQEKICDRPKHPVKLITSPQPFRIRFIERN